MSHIYNHIITKMLCNKLYSHIIILLKRKSSIVANFVDDAIELGIVINEAN
jgi:hypothetical protein